MTTAAGRTQVAYLVHCALPPARRSSNRIRTAPATRSRLARDGARSGRTAPAIRPARRTSRRACWHTSTRRAFTFRSGCVSPNAAVGWGQDPSYPNQEATFFGNIFTPGAHGTNPTTVPDVLLRGAADQGRPPAAGSARRRSTRPTSTRFGSQYAQCSRLHGGRSPTRPTASRPAPAGTTRSPSGARTGTPPRRPAAPAAARWARAARTGTGGNAGTGGMTAGMAGAIRRRLRRPATASTISTSGSGRDGAAGSTAAPRAILAACRTCRSIKSTPSPIARSRETPPRSACVEAPLPDAVMQQIAAENNLSETAFVDVGARQRRRGPRPALVHADGGGRPLRSRHARRGLRASYRDRPGARQGHLPDPQRAALRRAGRSRRDGPRSSRSRRRRRSTPARRGRVARAIGVEPREVVLGKAAYFAELESAAAVRAVTPDFAAVAAFGTSVCVTATGADEARAGRLRVALLRAGARHPRGSGDRLRALHADPLLGRASRQAAAARAPGEPPRSASSPARSTAIASASAAPAAWSSPERSAPDVPGPAAAAGTQAVAWAVFCLVTSGLWNGARIVASSDGAAASSTMMKNH